MKSCQVFIKGDIAFVFPQSTTRLGIGLTTEPMLKVSTASLKDLGDAVRTCLDASKRDIPDPIDFSPKAILCFAGEKSWKRFVSGATLRAIWLDNSRAKIVSYDPAERGSFELREDLSKACPLEPPEELGRAILASAQS
jgi:hypothetical protein